MENKTYLQCGDSALVFVEANASDPRDAGTAEEGKHTFSKRKLAQLRVSMRVFTDSSIAHQPHEPCPNGAWIFEGLPQEQAFYECQKTALARDQEKTLNPAWCATPGAYGQAVITSSAIILGFCDRALSTDAWSVKEDATKIQEGQDFRFHTYLQFTWIRTMFHYIDRCKQPRVSASTIAEY